MSRLKADALLLLTAVIWGTAFIAQKDAFLYLGPCSFVAMRFALATLVVLPFALRERARGVHFGRASGMEVFLILAAFTAGVVLQQIGVGGTSVTNAGFFAGIYALFVPFICRLGFGQKLPSTIFPASLACVLGVWLLTGGSLSSFAHVGRGDAFVTVSSLSFALQIVLVGRVMAASGAPFQLCVLQYAAAAAVAGAGAFLREHPAPGDFIAAAGPLLYGGLLSGGVAFTVQIVAQRYTPPSDAALIMSAEAVFAALAGALMRGETLTPLRLAGCVLILAAIMAVEIGAFRKKTG